MTDFTHIHTHTDFSTLDGFGSVGEYAQKSAANGMKYLCVTDHGMGAAYPRMLEECLKVGVKPVFGCEVYVNNWHHLVPEFKSLSDEDKYKARKNYHLVLIAKNNVGYENLVKLISEGWINGFYYKPRVSWVQIKQHAEGLICTSACCGSEYAQLINNDKFKEALGLIKESKEVFGPDFYLEMQMIGIEDQDRVNLSFIEISKKLDIPLVMTNDVHYAEKEHSYHQKIELLLSSKGTINKPEGLEFHTDQLWYKTPSEMDEMWQAHYAEDIPEKAYREAMENTVKICESTDVVVDTSPKFPKMENAEEILLTSCLASLKKNGLYNKADYRQRFTKEYEIICEKDFASYFLVVQKIIDWAKANGSSVGPGRGCFLPDNVIITKNDLVKISEVDIGDEVMSHDGKFHKVLEFYEYDVDEEVISIRMADGRMISCTKDHEILVKVDDNTSIYRKAKSLKPGDEIVSVWSYASCGKSSAKIKTVKVLPYKGKVYDLKVAETSAYNIEGLVVHNSGAGSLLCYLLGITQVDPIKHDLLFERFLSPSRGGKFAKLQFKEADEIA